MSLNANITEIDHLKKRIDDLRASLSLSSIFDKELHRVPFIHASSVLEGNPFPVNEISKIMKGLHSSEACHAATAAQIVDHNKAFDALFGSVAYKQISGHDILHLHKLLYNSTNRLWAGVYREEQVISTGADSIFPQAEDVPLLMAQFLQNLGTMRQAKHPVLVAAFAHLRLLLIYPFIDGNGRVARLLMNMILMQEGYPMAIIKPLMKNRYLSSVKLAIQGNEEVFFEFIAEVIYQSLLECLELLLHRNDEAISVFI